MAERNELTAYFLEQGYGLDCLPAAGKNPYQNQRFLENYQRDPGLALLMFGFEPPAPEMSPGLLYLNSIARRFIQSLAQNAAGDFASLKPELDQEAISEVVQQKPFAIGEEYVDALWLADLWETLLTALKAQSADYGAVADFLTAHDPSLTIYGRVYFHLVESPGGDYPFAFLATYAATAGKGRKRRSDHLPLKNALIEFAGQRESLLKLLSTVSRAMEQSNFISELVESGEIFHPLKLTAHEAYTFLREIPLYQECGIICRMPAWWRKKTSSPGLSVSIGEQPPSILGWQAMLSFNPSICLGDQTLTREEIEALLNQSEGLSFIKGRWVEVDHEKLKAVLEAYDQFGKRGAISFRELIQMQLSASADSEGLPAGGPEISHGQWLSNQRQQLLQPELLDNLPLNDDFRAELRHYQQKGAGWLNTMRNLGFGALLADDMGLGKTVQILALLEYLRQQESGLIALLVIPASLIGNWEKEIVRFAPKLRYTVLHSNNTSFEPQAIDLAITTYGMTMRIEALFEQQWDLLILDEAQAIKNPGTKQTKAVKRLSGRYRIAMTGTPIENKLADLWSLFDFLNCGLLGTAKEFSNYARGLQNRDNIAKLREVISPFILRRLKTDKTIISDLPEKLETKAFAGMSKKQVVLYSKLVQDIKKQLETAEGIQRKGLVLASIMKFKQICNHPDQYLGMSDYSIKHSGKFEKLLELCETIREKHERALIFTQFRELCEPLAEFLADFWGRPGLVLHGGIPVRKRAAMVERFNGKEYLPFMVLSIKAGGVGLNLTAANHVIHFDRWWNPAVEDQATDRAFRIGQKKNVVVHKMITLGSIEEKIDAVIEDKQRLSRDLIADSGENWITEMSDEQLLDLLRLDL